MKKNKFIVLFTIFLLQSGLFLFSESYRQIDTEKENPSWQTVIGGKAVANILQTKDFISVINDGRIISGISYDGKILWQENLSSKPDSFFSNNEDFFYLITNSSTLNFINPCGKTIWKEKLGFTPVQNPIPGLDGRVFVFGKNNAACYGINGRRKWKLELPELKNTNITQFEDGSLLAVEQKLKNGKSFGLRISPFGEIIEEITFASEILSCKTTDSGILLTFKDGSFGLCTIKNGISISKWVQKTRNSNLSDFKIIPSKNISCVFYNLNNDLLLYIIENKTGKLQSQFKIENFSLNEYKTSSSTNNGFFIANSKKALEFDKNGNIIWQALLPSKQKVNYITFTSQNQLILSMQNWVLKCYKMTQTVTQNTKSFSKNNKNYIQKNGESKKIDGVLYFSPSVEKVAQLNNKIFQKDISIQEKEILIQLDELLSLYVDELTQNSAVYSKEKNHNFSNNPILVQSLLEASSKSETTVFTSKIAELIVRENDPLLKQIIIQNSANIKFDKNGEILDSFLAICNNGIQTKDEKLCFLICDATYEIVNFMGRPAFYKQGKEILTQFMYPKYSKAVREYAIQTLSKILENEI